MSATNRTYGARGNQAQRANSRRSIEGESVTLAEIGARIGKSESIACVRLKREQALPGPVTWAGLALTNKQAAERGA